MGVEFFWTDLPALLAQTDPPVPVEIPDPPPQAPPGKLADAAEAILAWIKWGGIVAGVAGFVIAGIMMEVGRRNRNQMAIEAAMSLPWSIAGLSLVLGAASLVAFVIQ